MVSAVDVSGSLTLHKRLKSEYSEYMLRLALSSLFCYSNPSMHIDHHIATARSLTFLLENRFRVFGFRFGLDPILGLAPWIGDIISALLAFYIVWIGVRVGVPSKHIDRMVRNILFDLLIGVIPIVGTVGDFLFRSNSRNLDIVLKHYNQAIDGEYTDVSTAAVRYIR